MKKLNIAILAAAFATSSFAETLYVSGKPIDQKIIDQAIAQFKKSSPMAAQQLNNPQFKTQLLQSIGMQQAILAEGNSQGLDKSPAYQEKLQQVKPMVYAQMLQEKSTSVAISDADVKAKYEELKKQNISQKQKQYNVSHILVKDKKTAYNIEAQLKKGANFNDLAKKYSTAPGSKTKGGELGWSDGSNYAPEFTAAVKTLQKGKYTTTPIKTQFGFHIIKLNDIKSGDANNNIPEFDKIKDQIKQQLQSEKTRALFDSLKTKYKVEIK